jgi:hypothetical protein
MARLRPLDPVVLATVGPRDPCPCGSRKKVKHCHGRAAAQATAAPRIDRPFAGLADEVEWVALREIVPAATAPLVLADPGRADGRDVLVATVLPLAAPAFVRRDGTVLVALQTATSSGDPSRDAAAALDDALTAPPGVVTVPGLPGQGPRLQDLLDTDAALDVTVHPDLAFWSDPAGEDDPLVRASRERADAAIVATTKVGDLPGAYRSRMGERDYVRWVQPHEEGPLLDALARLKARGIVEPVEGSRLLGTFRAHGLLVPVWEVPPTADTAEIADHLRTLREALDTVLEDPTPLGPDERRARAGLTNRQITLR